MCLSGARSETARQLKDVLQLTNLTDDDILKMNDELIKTVNNDLGRDIIINTANKIYSDDNFELEKSFVDTIENHFHGEIEQVDFSDADKSSKKINDWVLAKTNNKIKDLINKKDIVYDHRDRTGLILINTIYFKGCWYEQFSPYDTSKEDFYCANGSKVKVDMMKLFKKRFKLLENFPGISGQVCTLPYDGSISMTIFLPNANTKLEVLEKQLTANKLIEILDANIQRSLVNVYLPKFKMEFTSDVS